MPAYIYTICDVRAKRNFTTIQFAGSMKSKRKFTTKKKMCEENMRAKIKMHEDATENI